MGANRTVMFSMVSETPWIRCVIELMRIEGSIEGLYGSADLYFVLRALRTRFGNGI